LTHRLPKTGALAKFKAWTALDDQKLTEAYSRAGAYAAMRALPKRSKTAILHRAQRLGLQRRRRWTPDDDQHLTSLWGTASVGWIARHLKRTAVTTYWRAQKIGLPLGCPQGHEYLHHAAQRTGYTSGQLRDVLKAAGVRLCLSMARPNAGRHRFHTVDPLDVDDAVAKWLDCEVVTCAAEARGIGPESLRQWLVAAKARGVAIPDPPTMKKGRWRVPSQTIDSVVAWHGARESLSSAAQRVGVKLWRLREWLIESGVPTGRVRPWLLERVAVDRVVAERSAKEAA
jgi:hypothetical protein